MHVLVRPQADVMHCELDVMSEDFSQKCLQLSHTEQTNKGQETELRLKENQLGQLRRENQVYLHFFFLLYCAIS